MAIPVMSLMLLFGPKIPLWAKQVNALGPGVSNPIPKSVSNSK
jgi:hypothetical protein